MALKSSSSFGWWKFQTSLELGHPLADWPSEASYFFKHQATHPRMPSCPPPGGINSTVTQRVKPTNSIQQLYPTCSFGTSMSGSKASASSKVTIFLGRFKKKTLEVFELNSWGFCMFFSAVFPDNCASYQMTSKQTNLIQTLPLIFSHLFLFSKLQRVLGISANPKKQRYLFSP